MEIGGYTPHTVSDIVIIYGEKAEKNHRTEGALTFECEDVQRVNIIVPGGSTTFCLKNNFHMIGSRKLQIRNLT